MAKVISFKVRPRKTKGLITSFISAQTGKGSYGKGAYYAPTMTPGSGMSGKGAIGGGSGGMFVVPFLENVHFRKCLI